MPFRHEALGIEQKPKEAIPGGFAGESSTPCPITGLPVIRKPEWTNVHLGKDYTLTFKVLGENILLLQPSGFVDLEGVKNAINWIERMVQKEFPNRPPLVAIEDYSDLRGTSIEARRCYIDFQKRQNWIQGLIFCNVPSLQRMGIKLAKRLHIFDFNPVIANDYPDAVERALDTLSNLKAREATTPNKRHVQDSENSREREICPFTGLPITSKPEWTNIDLGEGYTVAFKLIGSRILHSSSAGNSGAHGIENFFKERKKVIHEMVGPDEPFFELRDFSDVTGRVTKALRDQLAKGMRETEDRTIGWIGYGAPKSVRLVANAGKWFHKAKFPMVVVGNYEAAIKKAAATVKSVGYDITGTTPEQKGGHDIDSGYERSRGD